ncbi:MAG: hypothetical protein GXY34_04930 [Syntrophomonadaceae bacterium]|nr:hypothetical protein [Syntrophomonadaceae bacterium]
MAERIDRGQKNKMRAQLEEIAAFYREAEEKMGQYERETEVGEYKRYWRELIADHHGRLENLSRYMVIRCNR